MKTRARIRHIGIIAGKGEVISIARRIIGACKRGVGHISHIDDLKT